MSKNEFEMDFKKSFLMTSFLKGQVWKRVGILEVRSENGGEWQMTFLGLI